MDLIYFSLGKRYMVELGYRGLLEIWSSFAESFWRAFLLERDL